MKKESIGPKTTIGHVHLKVADLNRSVKFYSDVLGFEVMSRIGESAAFLSAGGYHHHIGLNTWESKNSKPPPKNSTGLYHYAILVSGRKELAKVYKRLKDADWPIEGLSDHGVSEAIYLSDPDGNGIEIYADRPRSKWTHGPKGNLIMYTKPLNISSLLRELK